MAISPAVAQAITGQRAPDIMGSFQRGVDQSRQNQERARQDKIRELSGMAAQGEEGALSKLEGLSPETAFTLRQMTGAEDDAALDRMFRDAETALGMLMQGQDQQMLSFTDGRIGAIKHMGGNTDLTQGVRDLVASGDRETAIKQLSGLTSSLEQAKKGVQDTAKLTEFDRWNAMPEGREKTALGRVIGVETRSAEGEGKLSAGLEKVMFEAQDKELSAGAKVRELEALANDFTDDLESGTASTLSELFKRVAGTQDGASELRRRLQKVRLSQALTLLPPGPATDKDVEEAMKGVPRDNAGPEQVRAFLRGSAKISRLDEAYNRFKARYISDKKTGTGMNRAFRQAIEDGEVPAYDGVIAGGVDATGSGSIDDLVNQYAK